MSRLIRSRRCTYESAYCMGNESRHFFGATLPKGDLLAPNSIGADRLRDFILEGGVSLWFMDNAMTTRAFELMEQYGDHLRDLVDASLIVAAESLRRTKIFTLDLADFQRYRIRRGHRHIKVEILG